MSVNYSWTFPTLFVKLIDDSLTNVVTSVMWICSGVDGASQTSSDITGAAELSPPDPEHFISYEDITYDDMYGWVSSIVDMDAIQIEISNVIDSKINGGIEPMSPPFSE